MAICERTLILVDKQIRSRGAQVENRRLILPSERWHAIWARNSSWETKNEARSILAQDIAVR